MLPSAVGADDPRAHGEPCADATTKRHRGRVADAHRVGSGEFRGYKYASEATRLFVDLIRNILTLCALGTRDRRRAAFFESLFDCEEQCGLDRLDVTRSDCRSTPVVAAVSSGYSEMVRPSYSPKL